LLQNASGLVNALHGITEEDAEKTPKEIGGKNIPENIGMRKHPLVDIEDQPLKGAGFHALGKIGDETARHIIPEI